MPRKKKVTTTTTTVVTEEIVSTEPRVTRIALVIDRSGSMGSVKEETFQSINKQIRTIKKNAAKGGKTFVTYIQFDDEIETVFANIPAGELKEISTDQYQPRGYTALYDATLRAVNTLPQKDDPEDVGYLLVVVTDGDDNRSKEISQPNLAALIKKLEKTEKWTVTYLLSNIDARAFSQAMGTQWGNIATYTSNTKGVNIASTLTANSLGSYMDTRSRGISSVQTFYNPDPIKTDIVTADPVDITSTTGKTTI